MSLLQNVFMIYVKRMENVTLFWYRFVMYEGEGVGIVERDTNVGENP